MHSARKYNERIKTKVGHGRFSITSVAAIDSTNRHQTFDRRGNREAWFKLRERDKVRKTAMGMEREKEKQHTTQPARDFERLGEPGEWKKERKRRGNKGEKRKKT